MPTAYSTLAPRTRPPARTEHPHRSFQRSDRQRDQAHERRAAANAAADAKEKERVDTINKADSIIFQTEKQLQELGDKIPADKKTTIEGALSKLKDAHKAQDVTAIESAIKGNRNRFRCSPAGHPQRSGTGSAGPAAARRRQAGPQPGSTDDGHTSPTSTSRK